MRGRGGAAVGPFAPYVAAGGDDGHEYANGDVSLIAGTVIVNSFTPYAGLIFRNVNIPAGATVTAAHINIVPNTYDDPNLVIWGEYDPASFAATSNNLSSRTKTAANVAWSAANIGLDAYHASPDISAVIQEIIETVGWASGDNLALYLIDNGGGP